MPVGATQLEVVMACSVDVDLYTLAGQLSSQSNLGCRPCIDGSSNEACTIENPVPDQHFIMVRDWNAFPMVTATSITAPPTGGGNVLVRHVSTTGLSGAAGDTPAFTFEVSATATSCT